MPLTERETEKIMSHLEGFPERAKAMLVKFEEIEREVDTLREKVTSLDKELSILLVKFKPIEAAVYKVAWVVILAVIGAILTFFLSR